MRKSLIPFLAGIYSHCLALRYDVEVHGEECLKSGKPLLILPRHIALVDPQLLFTELFRCTSASPVIAEKYYRLPILGFLFRKLGAVCVQDVTTGAKQEEVRNVFSAVTNALQAGRNIVLYPSGQLAGQGKEAIFGKQSAFEVVKNMPNETHVIGVRIRGLWGSMWSRAWIGKSPPFFQTFLRAILIIFANGIFFVPKRHVILEFEDITAAAREKSQENIQEFNTFLEHFYNIHGEEEVNFLRHYCYAQKSKRSLPVVIEGSLEEIRSSQNRSDAPIDEEILRFLRAKIHELKDIPAGEILPESHLILDLGFDSLGMAELVAIVRKAYPRARDISLKKLKTVTDICLFASGEIFEQEALPPCSFDRKQIQPAKRITIDSEKSLAKQIVETLLQNPNEPFCYDARLGSLTRRDFLRQAFVIARILKKSTREKHIGIMLPASTASALIIAACYFAGKIPVMFNWTVGEAAFLHCLKTSGVQRIITSQVFHLTIKEQVPESLTKNLLFLESLLQNLSSMQKAVGLLQALVPGIFIPRTDISQTAVVLFTSGSEALPKTVPLSQKNILADLAGTLQRVKVDDSHIMLSFLPPFHSFGFTATVLLPLLCGIRVAYTPDPSDARAILRMLKQTGASVMLSTPTFLRMLLAEAKSDDLKTLRLVISGAESCPKDMFQRFAAITSKDVLLLEGYGITECSPVVSINPPELQKAGSVGVLIEGLNGIIVDPETLVSLAAGKSGMILVRGDSVFAGYGGKNPPDPFVTAEGKNWYRTGDIGYFDADGYLFITGRLSRFLKIGGEMISLPFIEHLLLTKMKQEDEAVLAVEGDDSGEKPKIVVFTTRDISRDEANDILRQGGASNLMRVDEVRKINKIPVLGTGKTDYRALKKLV